MKALKPSHKERKRYLLIKGKNANREDVEKVILEFIGVLGFAEANPKVIKQNSQSMILSVNRESLDKIRASFSVSDKDLEITRVSGAIGKLE